jgi:hypothetical protein
MFFEFLEQGQEVVPVTFGQVSGIYQDTDNPV